jgi:uncharacterized damage-inducible protein DinB
MEVTSIASFLAYYEKTREVTRKISAVIPPDKMDWTYREGKFTLADQIRHIAAIERHLFGELIQNKPHQYLGCGKDLADGYEMVLNYFDEMHHQTTAIIRQIPDSDLKKIIKTASGQTSTVAAFLRALIVHEIHHRSSICIYLNILNVTTPQVMGMRAEDLVLTANIASA